MKVKLLWVDITVLEESEYSDLKHLELQKFTDWEEISGEDYKKLLAIKNTYASGFANMLIFTDTDPDSQIKLTVSSVLLKAEKTLKVIEDNIRKSEEREAKRKASAEKNKEKRELKKLAKLKSKYEKPLHE